MSTPDRIASTGKLSDRLAKLGLNSPPTSSPPSSSPGPKTTPAVRTGAVHKISDKISRFQANAEEKPLLPEGGSFGLAKPRLSGTSHERATPDKSRVVSLGGGRAPVPLDVVKPRSASASNSPRTSENGSAPSSRSASRQGSSRDASEAESAEPVSPFATQEESTPVPSPTQEKMADSLNPLPSGMRTPGAMSVSSMLVETGSVTSEGGANPAEIDVAAALAARSDSPLSSPQLAGIAVAASTSGSVSSFDGITPSLPTAAASKNPLDSLRASSPRPGSIHSISSLHVEATSEDVADLADMSAASVTSDTVPTDEGADGTPSHDHEEEVTREQEEASEAARAAQVSVELAQYERDERDPPALGPYQEEEPATGLGGGDDGEPKEPPPTEEEVERMELSRPDTPKASEAAPPSPVPTVKCSDCHAEVSLVELADHSCDATNAPPALSSPPTSPQPQPQQSAIHSPPPPAPERPAADVPEEPLDSADERDEPDVQSHSRSTSRRSKHQSGVEKLDAFVPQTDDLVPEDVLDMYADDEEATTLARSGSRTADVPSDELEDGPSEKVVEDKPLVSATSSSGQEDATATSATQGGPSPAAQDAASSVMERSASTPAGPNPRLRQSRSTKPRVQSAYGGPMPGRYYTSEDEDEGEAGSATIVRSSSFQNSP